MTQFKVVDNKKFDDYQIEVLIKQLQIDPYKLRFNKEYQRAISEPRWKPIYESIHEYGYWPFAIIIVNEKWEIVDGQHRAVAAIEANVDSVPICKVRFPNKRLEAKFFTDVNNYNTKLKPIDFWDAKYLSGDPLAVVLYKFESDNDSLFCQNIAIKGKSTNSKFRVSDAITIISSVALGYLETWQSNKHQKICNALYSQPYEAVLQNTNEVINLFYRAWGSKKETPFAYRTDVIRAVLSFFFVLKKHKKHTEFNTYSRMKSFVFTSDFIRSPHIGKVQALVNYYNHKKQKNRIEFVA